MYLALCTAGGEGVLPLEFRSVPEQKGSLSGGEGVLPLEFRAVPEQKGVTVSAAIGQKDV